MSEDYTGVPSVGDGGASPTPAPAATSEPTPQAADPSGGASAGLDEFADLAQTLDGDPRKDAFLNRLGEVSSRYQELKTTYQPFQGWIDPEGPIARLSRLGVTPEQMVQQIEALEQAQQRAPAPQYQPQGQYAPQDPEQAYAAWVQQKTGLTDPESLGWETGQAMRALFQQEQSQLAFAQQQTAQLAELRQWQQQQTQAAEQMRRDAEMASIANKMPHFHDPDLQAAVVARHQANPRQTLTQHAEALHRAIQTLTQAGVAQYAAGKQGDGQVPVVAGGGAVSPVPPAKSIHDMSRQEQDQYLDGVLSARAGAGR